MNKLIEFYNRIKVSLKLRFYRRFTIPYLEKKIQDKDIITVLFVVWSLGSWKSEALYFSMLNHPRFNAKLVVGNKVDEPEDVKILKDYCNKKGYNFDIVDDISISFWKSHKPDIIFYNKPYGGEFVNNLKSLFCYTTYAFHSSIEDWFFKTPLIYNCWQVYYENKKLRDYYSYNLGRGVNNGYATGIPPMDDLLTSKEFYTDPWPQTENKKRIIYAPHHSINPDNLWKSSSFLEIGELMLELAEKYSDKIQWVFKPHPLLRGKLEKIWGKHKTDEYFDKWANSSWSSFQDGEYLSLFKYSDALIHDSGSFIIEYHSTGNPVMYLLREKEPHNPWNQIFQKAYDLHYKGRTQDELEQFIQNVINGIDPRKEERQNFFKKTMTPPFTRTACENIIDCILSKDAKKKYR